MGFQILIHLRITETHQISIYLYLFILFFAFAFATVTCAFSFLSSDKALYLIAVHFKCLAPPLVLFVTLRHTTPFLHYKHFTSSFGLSQQVHQMPALPVSVLNGWR